MSFCRYHEFLPLSRVFVLAFLLFLVTCELAAQQRPSDTPQPAPTASAQVSPPDPQFGRERNTQRDQMEEKLEQDRKKAMNKQRQASLQKDTDKLYQLATELKNYVDKTNEHTLSLDVIKKAEEVEKLAKKVKEKMKETY